MLEDEFLEAGDELLIKDLAVLVVLVQLRAQLVPSTVTRRLRRTMRNSEGRCQMPCLLYTSPRPRDS